ncbi:MULTISPECIES: gephyrin-like molybdotransferase Glp [unclassified Undibacterium]|uniref:molybdopterin molybdotransferase MoeA n=1 Tax=unclassified Undibacterium TaxID=2630295 RepID=UPI002AC8D6CF|nr:MULTISPECIES: gephyrin-like molybdotransferase Glp [unclassified Undibacterium]MEB0138709.1 molybdopterin-binding protein [Undibacterium sp. CCC2.1]MEB0171510.1 molybdopterin-binding protein [Undibacterium sp. CCC1.1]MEB0175419.1 molybdopterin-binding protein [Undibacterium sp. CCC3.4]MEB0214710.1 molybdopterin-binding protein [Undibacterium sp. 5I2]WPX43331.1 molybdopterin-binding protein [Undibacterium sp. CCC3.4]
MKLPLLPHAKLNDVLSCLADYDPQAVPVAQAQDIIEGFITPIAAVEQLALRSALGRVLAKDIQSAINVPAHDNSAMDGYAVVGAQLPEQGERRFRIVGSAFAGRAYHGSVEPDECVRIMTGAVMPAGCDTVIPQEFTHAADAEAISVRAAVVRSGDNRRLAGEDLAIGKTALKKGKILRPADLGLLASLGIAEVPVQRRLRVAFFSTGDELRSLGQTLDEGCVYDSNRYTLHGMLTRLGCELIDMGVVADDPAALRAALACAAENADAIITSGGVSVGAADYTKQIMAELGDVAFWTIGMRPGRPMAFGKIHSQGQSAYLFGLPGNPVAVMVTFLFFVRQALLHMAGAHLAPLPLVAAISPQPIKKRPGRTEYQRGIVSNNASGALEVCVTGAQGSGILRSMAEANCMIVLDHEQDQVAAGDTVRVILFEGLM